jgi:hypothetical protein
MKGRCLAAATPFCGGLVLLLTKFFSGTLSRQRLLHSALCARFQVEGMTLYFLNDVFRLNLALEPTQGILDRLPFLQSNFCQLTTPSCMLRSRTPSSSRCGNNAALVL